MAISGLLCAIGSAICNGSFASVSKYEIVARCNVHPILFNLYVCLGVAVSSLLALPFMQYNTTFTGDNDSGTEFNFSSLGFASGALLVIAFTFSFLAIPLIGVSVAQGVWGGVSILVAFLWGVVALGNTITSWLGAIGAILLLLIGVTGIAFCDDLAKKLCAHYDGNDDAGRDSLSLQSALGSSTLDHHDLLLEDGIMHQSIADKTEDSRSSTGAVAKGDSDFVRGIIFACVVGVSGGSILVPMHYVTKDAGGVVFIPSFGVGVIAAAPIITAVYSFTLEDLVYQDLYLWPCVPFGMLAGVIWNLGNALSIVGISYLGYGVAYPLMQCALVISGLWGILVFKEIKGWAVRIFALFCILVLGGAAILTISVGTN